MTILIRLSDYPFHLAAVACGEHFAWLEDNFLVNKTWDTDSRRYCRYHVSQPNKRFIDFITTSY